MNSHSARRQLWALYLTVLIRVLVFSSGQKPNSNRYGQRNGNKRPCNWKVPWCQLQALMDPGIQKMSPGLCNRVSCLWFALRMRLPIDSLNPITSSYGYRNTDFSAGYPGSRLHFQSPLQWNVVIWLSLSQWAGRGKDVGTFQALPLKRRGVSSPAFFCLGLIRMKIWSESAWTGWFTPSEQLICKLEGSWPSETREQTYCSAATWTVTEENKYLSRDFPGGPAAKTLSSQCWGPGFHTWSGN